MIHEGVLQLVSSIFHDEDLFPYNAQYRRDLIHPAIMLRAAEVDHVLPITLGGTTDWDNLVTACCGCNIGKSNYRVEELGWQLDPPTPDGWDGLTSAYEQLWRMSGYRDAKLHQDWMQLLDSARAHWGRHSRV